MLKLGSCDLGANQIVIVLAGLVCESIGGSGEYLDEAVLRVGHRHALYRASKYRFWSEL